MHFHCYLWGFYLFVHDVWQLPGQVPVVGLHLIMILLLILFDEPLVHSQRLTAGIHKLPAERCNSLQNSHEECRPYFHRHYTFILSMNETKEIMSDSRKHHRKSHKPPEEVKQSKSILRLKKDTRSPETAWAHSTPPSPNMNYTLGTDGNRWNSWKLEKADWNIARILHLAEMEKLVYG